MSCVTYAGSMFNLHLYKTEEYSFLMIDLIYPQLYFVNKSLVNQNKI
jgi:hypothetical protein